MKYDLAQIEATLQDRKVDQPTITSIIKDLEQVAQEEQEEKEANKLPQKKWQHVVFANDPENKIGTETEVWVVVYEEGTDAGTVLQKLRDAGQQQNETAKRKKSRLTTLGEVFQGVKTKFLKDKKIKIKTKESVRLIPIDGSKF
jgi:molybdopterin converting factor small subunit